VSHSQRAENPPGGARARREPTQPALGDDLLERVLESANLRAAWQRVKANKGAPGVDGMSIEEFPAWAREHWPGIRKALLEGSYQPSPLRQREIPKPGGRGTRRLRIPPVLDRVILQALQQVLTPIFDPGFSESSFGYRPRRSAHGAVKQVQRFIREGYRIAVDLDVEKFFDRVDFDVLMARLGRRVADKRLLRLIGRFLRAGVVIDGQLHPTRQGIPQGSPLSPLLANVVLDDLDQELARRGLRFARYADDVVILVRSLRAGQRVMASVARFLHRRLKLGVNVEKSQVVPTDQIAFLGFSFRGTKICWSAKTMARFLHEVKRFTRRNWGVSMRRRLTELERYLRGWMAYFWISEYYRPIPEIDSWLRRRIRMCYWVQWRNRRTRINRLLKLGVGRAHAFSTGLSSHGPWHLARTEATQLAMSNRWLAQQGLVSFKDLWVALAHPR
jgi:RNA-directed DNA polymerase